MMVEAGWSLWTCVYVCMCVCSNTRPRTFSDLTASSTMGGKHFDFVLCLPLISLLHYSYISYLPHSLSLSLSLSLPVALLLSDCLV